MTNLDRLTNLYETLFLAYKGQGKVYVTRTELIDKRTSIIPADTYGSNTTFTAEDTKAMTAAARKLGIDELSAVGPMGKRSKVTFILNPQ
jgi:hypothetical protein